MLLGDMWDSTLEDGPAGQGMSTKGAEGPRLETTAGCLRRIWAHEICFLLTPHSPSLSLLATAVRKIEYMTKTTSPRYR